jgi:hypothetical protein
VSRAALLASLFVLALASTASAKNARVYVFAAAEGSEGFKAVSRTLADSATDIRNALADGWLNGLKRTDKRQDAAIRPGHEP